MSRHLTPGFLIAAVAFATSCSSPSPAPALTDHDTVIVADFANTTGDQVFDDGLKAALQVALQQSPALTLVSDQRQQRFMRLMKQPADVAIVGDVARELCKQTGAKAVVEGSIAAAGSGYTINLDAKDCAKGGSMASQQVKAGAKADVLSQLGAAAKGLRKALGENAATLGKFDADLTKATTSNLDALKLYGQGLRTRAIRGDDAAGPMFLQATQQDPAFAIGHAKLAVILGNVGEIAGARDETAKAYGLRESMTEYEREYIDWNYAARVTMDPAAVKAALETLTATYPRDFGARNNFGVYYNNTGDLDAALKQYQAASEIAPDEPGPLANSAYVLLMLGRYDEASAMTDKALAIRPDSNLAVTRWIAARAADLPRAGEFEAAARQLAGPEQIALAEASLAAWSGKFEQFHKMEEDLMAKARSGGNPELAESIAVGRMITLAAYRGGTDIAALKAASAKEKKLPLLVQETSALAMLGELDAARAGLTRLLADKDSGSLGPPLAVARAYVMAKNGHAPEAIASLQATLNAVPRARDLNYFVADIHEHSGDEDGAIQSYRIVINSLPYLGPNPLIPMSRLRLAKILTKKGDQAGAKEQIDALLKQWKDADGDFPALRETKALASKK